MKIYFDESNIAKAVSITSLENGIPVVVIYRGSSDPDCNIDNEDMVVVEIEDIELTDAIKNCELELQGNGDVKNLSNDEIYSQIIL